DTFQIIPAAGIAGAAQDNLLINVDGGNSGENNALVLGTSFGAVVGTLPATTFVVDNRQSTYSGTLRVFQNAVANPDINFINVTTVSPIVTTSGANGINANLLVMGPDVYEPNDFEANSAFIGSGSTLQIQNGTVFPNNAEFPGAPADKDYFQI